MVVGWGFRRGWKQTPVIIPNARAGCCQNPWRGLRIPLWNWSCKVRGVWSYPWRFGGFFWILEKIKIWSQRPQVSLWEMLLSDLKMLFCIKQSVPYPDWKMCFHKKNTSEPQVEGSKSRLRKTRIGTWEETWRDLENTWVHLPHVQGEKMEVGRDRAHTDETRMQGWMRDQLNKFIRKKPSPASTGRITCSSPHIHLCLSIYQTVAK